MTPQDIIDALFGSNLGVTAWRIEKAKGRAKAGKIPWDAVVAAMTDEQRAQLEPK